MDFLTRLQRVMAMNGDSKHKLSKDSGIPYTTIERLFNSGWENARISTIQKICDHYGLSIDFMVYGAKKVMSDELALSEKYSRMSPYGRSLIDLIIENEERYGRGIRLISNKEDERDQMIHAYESE